MEPISYTYNFRNTEGRTIKLEEDEVQSLLESFDRVTTITIPSFESFTKAYFLDNLERCEARSNLEGLPVTYK